MKQVFAILSTLLLLVSVTGLVVVLSDPPDIDTHRETVLSVRLMVSVENYEDSTAEDIPLRLAIPRDMPPYQYLESVTFLDMPERNHTDNQGNTFVYYTIDRLAPQEVRNITIDLNIRLVSVDFNIRKDSIGEFSTDTGGENLSRYLYETELINYNDPAIVALARELADDSNDIAELVWNSYDWVVEELNYQQLAGERDAAETLMNREGGSAEFGNLHVALLRANGIPARRVSGWGNHFEEGEELYLDRFAHGWTEFYLPGYGWIPSDPTWGQAHEFDNYAKTDNDHISLTTGDDISFLWRGPFSTPFGDTKVSTDYRITIGDMEITNLSTQRDIITAVIFGAPLILAIFVLHKKMGQRRV